MTQVRTLQRTHPSGLRMVRVHITTEVLARLVAAALVAPDGVAEEGHVRVEADPIPAWWAARQSTAEHGGTERGK